jgi:hypothetical protein
MKNLSKITGTALLTLGLAILPATLPAHATDTTGTNSPGTAVDNAMDDAADNIADTTDRDYSDGDWGLLGLLGLFGLLGRRSRKDEPTVYQETTVPTSRTVDRY